MGAGLAYQILLAGMQLNVPRLFAALFLIAVSGVALFAATGRHLARRTVTMARKRNCAIRLSTLVHYSAVGNIGDRRGAEE